MNEEDDMKPKEYLGDSVYVREDGYGSLVLTTENGLPSDPSNTIVLEPEVLEALLRYVDSPKVEPNDLPQRGHEDLGVEL